MSLYIYIYIYISPYLGGGGGSSNILGHVSQLPEDSFSQKIKKKMIIMTKIGKKSCPQKGSVPLKYSLMQNNLI